MTCGILNAMSTWLRLLLRKTQTSQVSNSMSRAHELIFIEEHLLDIMHNVCKMGYSQIVSPGGAPESDITDSTGATRYFDTLGVVIPLF